MKTCDRRARANEIHPTCPSSQVHSTRVDIITDQKEESTTRAVCTGLLWVFVLGVSVAWGFSAILA